MSGITSQMRKIIKQMEDGAYILRERDTFLEKNKWYLQDSKYVYSKVTEPMLDRLFIAGLIEQWDIPAKWNNGKDEELFCLIDKLPEDFKFLSERGEVPSKHIS